MFVKKPLILSLIILAFCGALSAQSLETLEKHRIHLPNGWSLTPAGTSMPLGDLPLNIAVSPSKKLLAVTNNGQSGQTIDLIDAVNQKLLDTIIVAKAWLGLCFSADEKYLFASGGNDNCIIRYVIVHEKLVPADTFPLGKAMVEQISPAGIAVDYKMKYLYAVTKEDNSLYIINIPKRKIVKKLPLGGEGYTCLLSPAQDRLYVSCWGCDKLLVFNTKKQKQEAAIPIGDNPNDMCITKDGKYLFVANANDNSVSVIDTRKKEVVETLNAALYPNAAEGSTTNSVALSEDDKTMYIANADNNCLAVFDVSKPGACKSRGFIPTGWYPTCVRAVNGHIFIANGKGFSSLPNPQGPNPLKKRAR